MLATVYGCVCAASTAPVGVSAGDSGDREGGGREKTRTEEEEDRCAGLGTLLPTGPSSLPFLCDHFLSPLCARHCADALRPGILLTRSVMSALPRAARMH